MPLRVSSCLWSGSRLRWHLCMQPVDLPDGVLPGRSPLCRRLPLLRRRRRVRPVRNPAGGSVRGKWVLMRRRRGAVPVAPALHRGRLPVNGNSAAPVVIGRSSLRRLFVAAMLAASSACTPQLARCVDDPDCPIGAYCERRVGVCVRSDAGGAGGGNGAPACEPPCPASSECVGAIKACLPRYLELRWQAPDPTEFVYRRDVMLVARLELNASRLRADPPSLPMRLGLPDGGSREMMLTALDAGLFGATAALDVAGQYQASTEYPDAGLSSPDLFFFADFTPPWFVVDLEPPTLPSAQLDFDSHDPGLPDGSIPYRRDAWIRMRVTSTIPAVDDSSLQVLLHGVGDGGSAPFVSRPAGCAPGLTCPGSGFCRCLEADLSAPSLPAMRGRFEVEVRGKTPASTLTVQRPAQAVGVTRFKWRRALGPRPGLPPDVASAPAIDSRGNVVVVVDSDSHLLYRLSPSGDVVGVTEMQRGPREISVDSRDVVYVRSSESTLSLSPPDGGLEFINCDGGGPAVGRIRLSYPSQFPGDLAGGFAEAENSTIGLVTFRRGDSACNWLPLGITGGPETPFVADGDYVWGRTPDGYIRQYAMPTPFSLGGAGGSFALGLSSPAYALMAALPGGLVLATVDPGNALVRTSYSGVDWRYTPPFGVSPTGLVITPAGNAIASVRTAPMAAGLLGAYSGDAGWIVPDALRNLHYFASPAIGAGGHVYLFGADPAGPGTGVVVSNLAGQREWLDTVTPEGAVEAAPLLDCTRDSSGSKIPGRPGVAYIEISGDFNGFGASLAAIVVDSAGIDTTAPWPMVFHDPRHTNNSATSLVEFRCP